MTEWMRDSGNGVTSEDYLLGKEIDKNFEQQGTMGQINAVEYGMQCPMELTGNVFCE